MTPHFASYVRRLWSVCLAGGLLAFAATPSRAAGPADDGAGLVRRHCSQCHEEKSPGNYYRVSGLRKTPEGWGMTLVRMQRVHGLKLSEQARDGILRYLADAQGLAPSESAAGRYALERRPNVPDVQLEGDTNVMCARCHSAARIMLQRRGADEWLKLVHTHVALWPTLEYHNLGRDRFWWQVATTDLPPRLEHLFPYESAAWTEWKARVPVDLAGDWLVTGHAPGRGDYTGTATIARDPAGGYTARYRLEYVDGTSLQGSSKAVVYTGYEWRGTATLAGNDVREVYALDASGNVLRGRWFLADHAETGADFAAERVADAPRLVAVTPSYLRTGATQTVVVSGVGLSGAPDFGPGTKSRVVRRDATHLVVDVDVDADAAPGLRTATVGTLKAATPVALYHRVSSVAVEPGYAVARVGGGRIEPVSAQFEAIAYAELPGADGRTASVRLGALPARWELQPFDAQAAQDKDVQFAGHMEANGRFTPAGAGPNPARRYSADNVGNLTIIGHVTDGDRQVSGKSHLIVTVQRWNTPPIY